jgi:uncharacterized membrane protein HdeD (DUF308 family)
MTTVIVEDVYIEPDPVPGIGWGWYLAAGIAWVFIGLTILTVQPATISLIGIMVGVVLLLGGVFELVMAVAAPGWRWLHAVAGVLFVIGGFFAFFEPFQTFVSLSILFGWYLVLMGTVVLIGSLATRIPGSLWGLGVTVGILEILLGLWAIGYPGRSAWLLILWVGVGAIFHGIADVVSAFHVRSLQRMERA